MVNYSILNSVKGHSTTRHTLDIHTDYWDLLGQLADLETPNWAAHRIQQGQTRMTSSPLLFATLFGKHVELFFTSIYLLNFQRKMSWIRSKKTKTRSDFLVVICSILPSKRGQRSKLNLIWRHKVKSVLHYAFCDSLVLLYHTLFESSPKIKRQKICGTSLRLICDFPAKTLQYFPYSPV